MLILVGIVISLIFPQIGLNFQDYIVPLMMLLMFLSFLNIDYHSMAQRMHHFKKPSVTLLVIHLLSPLLVLFLKPLFIEEIFLGLIIVSSVSSGLSVVFLSSLFKGNSSIALLITFFSNVLSPVILPVIIYLFTKKIVDIDYVSISLTIVKLVIIPLLLAMTIHKFNIIKPISKHSVQLSSIVLFFVILGIISPVQNIIFSNPELSIKLFFIVVLLTGINFFVGYFLGNTKEEKITYAITSNYKNYALASIIALSNFEPIVAYPAAMYALVNNLFLVPLQLFVLKKDTTHSEKNLEKATDKNKKITKSKPETKTIKKKTTKNKSTTKQNKLKVKKINKTKK